MFLHPSTKGVTAAAASLCDTPGIIRWRTRVFTARCTLVQSAVLRSHVICLSVTLVDCDHMILAWDVRSLQTQTSGVYSKGNTRKFWL